MLVLVVQIPALVYVYGIFKRSTGSRAQAFSGTILTFYSSLEIIASAKGF